MSLNKLLDLEELYDGYNIHTLDRDCAAMVTKGFSIRAAVDITSRVQYRSPIDPASDPFKRIVRHYWLSPQLQCGISSCRHWHNDGYLVELASGIETNIGHVCGRKYFGTLFVTGEDQYRQDILIPEFRQKLIHAKTTMQSLLALIRDMCSEGEGPGKQQRNFRRLFPKLTKALDVRAGRREMSVKEARERSPQEIERLVAGNPGVPRERFVYEEVVVGTIKGLDTFSENLGATLQSMLRDPVEAFLAENIGTATFKRLSELISWERSLDDIVARSKAAISNAKGFFSKENIELLQRLDLDKDERKKLTFTRIQSLATLDPTDIVKAGSVKKDTMESAERPERQRKKKGWGR